MYNDLTFTVKNDEVDTNIKLACFTYDNIYYEIRAIVVDGNVDNTATLQECKDLLELNAQWDETI